MEEEGDCEQIKKMSKDGYTAQYLKQKLKEHYGEYIYFSELPSQTRYSLFQRAGKFHP